MRSKPGRETGLYANRMTAATPGTGWKSSESGSSIVAEGREIMVAESNEMEDATTRAVADEGAPHPVDAMRAFNRRVATAMATNVPA